VYRKPVLGFDESVINIACRLEYVDWNVGTFAMTGGNIADHFVSVVPAISWRPGGQTVIRVNYRYNLQTDLLGNPAQRTAGFQAGFSSYF
jgi:peptidoglycan/xylan/chitin deacetylase (PgdA/CDA1 family)